MYPYIKSNYWIYISLRNQYLNILKSKIKGEIIKFYTFVFNLEYQLHLVSFQYKKKT